jgi:hypothetical protein
MIDQEESVVAPVPIHVRVFGVDLNPDAEAYLRRKLCQKLGKFVSSIERVSVRITDVNGPRGGVDQVCVIKAVLRRLPSVVVRRQQASLEVAIDGALRVIEQAVRAIVGRRRMKPFHRRDHVRRGF